MQKNGVTEIEKVKCPHCGYEMPIFRGKNATSKDLWVKCKGKQCKQEFEININNKIK